MRAVLAHGAITEHVDWEGFIPHSSGGWKSKVRVPIGLDCPLGCRLPPSFTLHPPMEEREREVVRSFL
jgi:hypothetical protein